MPTESAVRSVAGSFVCTDTLQKTNRRRTLAAVATALLLVLGAACSGGSSSTDGSATSTEAQSSPDTGTQLDSAMVDRIDAAIENTMTMASIPGAIVGVWGPDGNYVKALGVADKTSRFPMETDFYSRIGSVTKTFTVTGVLQLVDEGLVSLDDPISMYVEGVPSGDEITLRQLARMQSGLANYTAINEFQQALFANPEANFTPQQLLDYALAGPAAFPPGQGLEYSNTNTILLGLVVEKVSGMSLPEYLSQKITQPMNMEHTRLPVTNAFPEPHPTGYTYQTADGEEAVSTDWNPSWGGAAGAMISTLDDLRIWAPALATGALLQPETQAQRLEMVAVQGVPFEISYGLGIFDVGGWLGHNGSIPGYQTVSVYLPERETTLVIMINSDIPYEGNEPSAILAQAITEIISPEHVYRLSSDVEEPDLSISETPVPVPTR
ncbi:serine hydrolase domain-containing protein [Rhodococcus spongiicola]|uniref:Class A beta-lactamase-related serine hydrolase n=1 Tax=Rhodococcus spongiicola TaxID=2487352 RepID=A0A438B530_9NOCA|nr:serine hydrolase domain-containing protein [Rhodococcus spongiicola]RVW06049.1 class A beta-lactamase-related serine hydrolase [Rhodococcus spongiicola]